MPAGRYSADDIEVLPHVEVVRRRPSIFVEDPASNTALTSVLLEPLCLAVDEKTGGPARHVEFSLLDGDCAEVVNDGPGLPLGSRVVGGKELSFVEIIMTRLHACRAMKSDETHARWCHLGVSVLCALSEWSVVTVRRDGGVWTQPFARGQATGPLTRTGDATTTGTSVRFKPDRTILTGSIDVPQIEARLAEFSREVPCLHVSLRNLR